MFKNIFTVTIMTLSSLILVTVLGCSLFVDAITPCYIPPELAKVIDESPTSFLPYTTVFDAQRMLRKINYLTEGLVIGVGAARELQSNVLNPTGPLGLLLVGGPALTIGALGISKPKDKKKITELQNGKG